MHGATIRNGHIEHMSHNIILLVLCGLHIPYVYTVKVLKKRENSASDVDCVFSQTWGQSTGNWWS